MSSRTIFIIGGGSIGCARTCDAPENTRLARRVKLCLVIGLQLSRNGLFGTIYQTLRGWPPESNVSWNSACRLADERGCIFGGLGFDARLFEEAEVAEPVNEADLPGAERNAVAVGQAAGHMAAVGQRVAGVAAVGVNVQFDIRDAGG